MNASSNVTSWPNRTHRKKTNKQALQLRLARAKAKLNAQKQMQRHLLNIMKSMIRARPKRRTSVKRNRKSPAAASVSVTHYRVNRPVPNRPAWNVAAELARAAAVQRRTRTSNTRANNRTALPPPPPPPPLPPFPLVPRRF